MWIGDGELRTELSSSNIKVTGWISRDEALRQSNKDRRVFYCHHCGKGCRYHY